MAVGGGGVVALVVVDALLRRWILPLVLLAAVILRYNLISFSYLLLLLVVFLLPGPRLKSQKASNIIFLVILVTFSAVVALIQALFQFSLLTSYQLSPCNGTESTWRQFGFVQFEQVPAVDVIRHLLPDVVVFSVSLLALVINALVVFNLSTTASNKVTTDNDTATEEENQPDVVEPRHLDSERGYIGGVLSDHDGPPYPKDIQCYWRIPSIVSYTIEFGIFVMLGLSGIAVPSLTSFAYYAVFLVLLVIWSVHMKLAGLVRVLRTILTFYSALHLLVLHLFQLSSAQSHIQDGPCHVADCSQTSSLLARLFGLTPIIKTDCSRPTELLLWEHLNYTVFLNPAFVFVLFWLLATDLRMWMFTPGALWQLKFEYMYYLPIQDHTPSSTVKCVRKTKSKTYQILEGPKSYGTMGPGGLQVVTDEGPSPASSPDLAAPLLKPKKTLQQKMWFKLQRYAGSLVEAIFRVAFVFTVVAMMFWSVLYPSWPSLVLLLWSCGIWLVPKLNPRDSVVYTSPLLVLYSVALLFVQYTYSLGLMEHELGRRDDVVFECRGGTDEGCRSIVLLAKTLFTVIFFASFRDFVRVVKVKVPVWWRKRRQAEAADSHGEDEVSESTKKSVEARAHIYSTFYRLMCTYWVVVVVGAFLLVMLTGEPSALKCVYLVFFFLFLITYQVAERYWFFFSFPVWWLLVAYAAVHLILVYTYPFNVINKLWIDAYNQLNLTENNISADELYTSIGFIDYFSDRKFRTLVVTLVPPAVFIAALALQLRYFKPKALISKTGSQVASQAALDVYSLFPKTVRDFIGKLDDVDVGEESDEEENDGGDEESGDSSDPSPALLRKTTSMYSIKSSALKESHPKLYVCYRWTKYAFNKTRQVIVDLYTVIWRFLELHLHKIVALVLFATSVSQINAAYWVLLVLVLIVVPLPYLNPVLYPLITLYLGLLSTTKMVYNLPIMRNYYLNFTTEPRPCDPIIDEESNGTVYESVYSPRINDTNWIGLHPTDDFAHYVSLPLVCGLLLSLWFSARRYQARHYRSHAIEVKGYERRSLFLNVTRAEAEVSIVASLKYLINHFFEMYGIEVCWAMLAIAVAVRVDVYGVIYVVVLGIFFLTPRPLLSLILPLYLLLHGALLAVQYFFLLGAPPSVCYNKPNSTVYPWSNVDVESPSALKKWLFVPDDTQQILNSHLLYADFLVYIVVCLQLPYIVRNPLKQGSPDQVEGKTPNFYEAQYWIDYFKVFVFQYSFWFSLFLLFFTAAYRISLFGVVYLLIGFYFLYRGQDMLRDRQSKRHKSWALLRLITWGTLLIRVSIQIVDCVFWKRVQEYSDVDNCLLILLVNGACTVQPYYGSEIINCPDEPRNLGLWIDALNFIVVTLQIIIFDTQYAEVVKDELTRKVAESQSFRRIFDGKIKEYQDAQKEKQHREYEDLVERTEKLVVSEKKIDHLLYAGVRVPEDIEIRRPKHRSSTATSNIEDVDHDLLDSTSITSGSPERAVDKDKEKSTIKKFSDGLIEAVDWLIEQLEQSSALYREVVLGVKESASPLGEEERVPLAPERTRYGSTDETPLAPSGAESITVVEVHEDANGQGVEEPVASKEEVKPKAEKKSKKKKKLKKSKTVEFADAQGAQGAGGDVIDELHIEPSVTERQQIEQFEGELKEKALKTTSRLRRLSTAIYYFLLAHSDYPVFFFIILNIILNGSVLSLIYAALLYTWGLLSIPWPTRRFWLTLIFYTMSVLLIKYAFQFHDISYWSDNFDPSSGLYPPRVLGILHRKNFFTNAVWDILLLIALLLHRGLLVQYGLWSTDTRRIAIDSLIQFFVQLWKDVKEFFTRLFDPAISQGAKDYYVVMLFFDILCFITIVAGVNSFGFGIQTRTFQDLTAVADFVRNNNVPLLFVALLLLHFLSMVIDRAIYIRRSLPAKFAFQIILLLGWHIGLFFIMPSNPLTGRPFTDNTAAKFLYFFKSCYFIAASLQVVSGYPERILRYLLASSYNMVSWLAFLVYRLIPLLPELRETVDWTFTDTSLSLINWFKVQEIYSLIYLVKVQRTREKSYPRNLGQKQSWLVKIFAGGLLLIGLILLIWLPLLLISVIGQASETNPPVEVDVKLSIGGFQPLVELTVQERDIHPLNPSEYRNFTNNFNMTSALSIITREFRQEDFRRVVFPGQSTSLWTISPPSREQLLRQLNATLNNPNSSLPLDFSWSIKRTPGSNSNVLETVSGISTRRLSLNDSSDTLMALIESLTSPDPRDINVSFPNLFPTLIRAPSSEDSTAFTQLTGIQGVKSNRFNASCTAILKVHNATEVEWWSLTQNDNYIITPQISGQLEMIIYSERVAPQIFSLITGIGIIGLYVSVVLVIGRFIRTYIADLPYRLAVDEILNPDPLIKLCHDIYTVRESHHLELEEILVGKLFYIFRSSERIVRITEDLKEKKD